MSDEMSKLTYLTVKACMGGGAFWVVQEVLAKAALAHPAWDLTEMKSFAEWEADDA